MTFLVPLHNIRIRAAGPNLQLDTCFQCPKSTGTGNLTIRLSHDSFRRHYFNSKRYRNPFQIHQNVMLTIFIVDGRQHYK
jgi:hypothetical protein